MTHRTAQNKRSARRIAAVGRFSQNSKGAVSVELVIILPMLIWALAATAVFFDGFRTRYHAQMAAQTVADIMSRETNLFTAAYVEGMNDVFDFLVDRSIPTRIRVSSIIWDSVNERNMLQWSYGTRDLSGLPTDTFELMQNNDLETLLARFGEDESFSFAGAAAQMPVSDLPGRVPPVLPGEALLLVESFALWTPFSNVGLGQIRLAPVVVARPRFAPWINFDGVETIYPEPDYEIAWTGGGNETLPDPNDPPPDDVDDTGSIRSYNFDTGVTTGWSQSTVTAGSAVGGSFLGPFGGETYATPLSLAIDLGTAQATAVIEFDLLIIDGWDGYDPQYTTALGDTLQIMIDGQPISLDAFSVHYSGLYRRERSASGYINGAQFQLTLRPTHSGTNFAGGGFADQVWHAVLTITEPPAQFALGFSASLDEIAANESFGIDNLTISASGSATGRPFFTPPSANFTSNDPHTRFPRYSGCPDYRIRAPWLSVGIEDVRTAIYIPRQAGGPTSLRSCSGLPGTGYISASPSVVLYYDNQGRSGAGFQLAVGINDRNQGRACDSTILIRDPNGQYWFNDDFGNGYGYNAGLEGGNAISGQYSIWMGSYGSTPCNSNLMVVAY